MRVTQKYLFSYLLLCLIASSPLVSEVEIKGVDLFGSSSVSLPQILEVEHVLFERFCSGLVTEDDAISANVKKQLSNSIQKWFDLAYAKVSAITYFENKKKIAYITFDVVEHQDAAKRLDFQPEPTGTFTDPDGLIELWDEYMEVAWALVKADEIDLQEVKCQAFHSIFGHTHPKLEHFENQFINGVALNKSLLAQILQADSNPHKRAIATFLLAYLSDGQELVDYLTPQINDPSGEVRNNVLRVFGCIARNHSEIRIPMQKILDALNYPDTTDRNKAAFVIHGLILNEEGLNKYRVHIIENVGEILLKMLQLRQPNNSDWAHLILRRLSGLDIPKNDNTQWKEWLNSTKAQI